MSAHSHKAATLDRHGQEQPATVRPVRTAASETATARWIRAKGLVAGLSHAGIAEEIHDGCGPVAGTTWIRAYRLALGISLADVVAQVRAWYESEGREAPRFSETLLSAYESGQKRPGPEYLHYLCAVYRAEPGDLGYPGGCFCGRSHRRLHAAGPAKLTLAPAAGTALQPACASAVAATAWAAGAAASTPSGAAAAEAATPAASAPADGAPAAEWPGGQAAAGAEDDDDVIRRALLRVIARAASGVDGQFLGAVDRIRRRMDEALVRGTVSATMLDQWEQASAGYAQQYMTVPPLRLLCDVLLDFGDVRRMCERRQPLESSERLCRLAGQLAALAGMIMIDMGDQRLARGFFRTARGAADETGDRHLRAWVLVREALVPLYYGDPREACAMARAGVGLAGGPPSVAGTMGRMVEARSVARNARRHHDMVRTQALRRVQTLLCHAHEAQCRLPADTRGDTAFGYTERQLLFHEGDALVTFGEHHGAEKAFTRALRLYSHDEVLDRSLVELGLARCRLEADEPEEALRLSQDTVLGVPREHRSEILVRAARSLGDCVAGRHGDLHAVREYRDALMTA
ncbi:MAG TPA: XRE family transcriptional regulator [Streptosporangiaceae bacterium]|jgi:transcriptional regulator with XRE-family HTH domain